jgi:hypothetical protein
VRFVPDPPHREAAPPALEETKLATEEKKLHW